MASGDAGSAGPGGMTRRDFVRGATLAPAAPAFLPGCGSASTAPSIEEKIAQMLLVGFRGTALDGSEPIARDLRDLGIGGAILFDRDVLLKAWCRNVTSPEQQLRTRGRSEREPRQSGHRPLRPQPLRGSGGGRRILVGNNLAYDPDVATRIIELVAGWVRDGIVPESRIDDSWTRIQKAKGQFAPAAA